MSKTKKATVDSAVATIGQPKGTDVQKVSTTRSITQNMQQCPDWAAAVDVQAAVKTWNKDADAIDANAKTIATLREQLKIAEAHQEALRRNWRASSKAVVATVTLFCSGSVTKVKAFALAVLTRNTLGALEAPTALAVNPGTVGGDVEAKWLRGVARHGFLVQHATDPANAATVSPSIASTKSKFKLGGLPPNASISFRVAAIDPNAAAGQSPWSAWVLGNAR